MHAELWQISRPLQAFPSSQTIVAPARHAFATQCSIPLHALLSLHCASAPQAKPRQTPERHTSYGVLALPSLQGVSSGCGELPG
jgi:hypothetical protein